MSPRSEEQNEAIKDERREQILSGALRVFARKGFAAAKISDIVSRSGVSHGLVYHYFDSKEEIFFELLKRAIDTSSETLLMVDGMPISPLEKVRQTAQYILRGIGEFEESAYYFLIVIHASVMEGPKHYQDKYLEASTALTTMADILAEGQKTGEIRPGDTLQMSTVFFSAIQGLAMYKLAMADFEVPDPEILVNIVRK